MEKIGRRIKALRKKHGLTQAQLAAVSDLHGSTISRIEQGLVFPGSDILVKLADYFHVTCDYLLGIDLGKETSTVGYIVKDSETLKIVEKIENEQLREFKELYSTYRQLSNRNRQELLDYIKVKIKYQS